ILPTIVILFILNIGNFMQIGFEKVLLMQNTLNSETSDIIQTFVYETGLLEGQYSFAAAIGLFESAINIALLITVNQMARKVSNNSLWQEGKRCPSSVYRIKPSIESIFYSY